MAEITTVSPAVVGATPRQTNMPARWQTNGKIDRTLNPVWTIGGSDSASDKISLGYLEPGEALQYSLCNVLCENPGTTLVVDIGFRALNGAASAEDVDGNTVTNDVDLFADGLTLSSGGKVEFGAVQIDEHFAPTRFKERVEIVATIVTATSLTAAQKVQFNMFTTFA